MEKNYLRYAPQWFAGIITSPRAPVAALPDTKEVVCGAGRDVVCWRVRTGERTRTLRRGDETDLVGASPLDGPRGEVVAVAAAQELRSKAQAAIDERDFAALLAHDSMPETIHQVVAFVQCREDLHDKFWRYLTLFVDVISNAES